MTIAIALKVGDGVVLGADSAATLSGEGGVVNVYFNAEKLFNLVKGMPLGMAVYGLGGLSGRSVTSLAKDLRQRFMSNDPAWHLDAGSYTMAWVAERVRAFFYDELYLSEYPLKGVAPDGRSVEVWATMGFFIAGFSAGANHPELWKIEIDANGGSLPAALEFGENESGKAVWAGDPEALNRLFRGYSGQVRTGLVAAGLAQAEVDQFLGALRMEPLIVSAMPLQDAIDLVKYMVDVTVGFVKFRPGPPTVAEPTDVAAITKHEGFRWVRRKHYYSQELNPTV
jgi:hypothetical protein